MNNECLITLLDRRNEGINNRGFRHDRTKYGALEKAFADKWEEDNKPRNINHGQGILQDLFFGGHQWFTYPTHIVTPMERYVTATSIQWLGTNCGYAWLNEVLRKDNLMIREIPPVKPPDPPMKFYTRKIIS